MNRLHLFFIALLLSEVLCYAYPPLSPYSYCAGNPAAYIDPSGAVIEGITKKDASMAVSDFRAMFPGANFANFRNLIVQSGKKQNGKTFAPISEEALSNAFIGVALNEDQQSLVEMVVNTINSSDVHQIEYVTSGKEMSNKSLRVYAQIFNSMGITQEMAASISGGYFQIVRAFCGEASTVPTPTGSLSLILKDTDAFATNRPAIVGHEIIGHGRSYRLGYTDNLSQHVFPIQVENLILRNMGSTLFRNGSDHEPLKAIIPNCTSIPSFR